MSTRPAARRRAVRRTAQVAGLSVAALAASAAPGPAAASRTCASRPGALTGNRTARVWHTGAVLLGCSHGRTQTIGAWHAGDLVRLEGGATVLWTTRSQRTGGPVDRVSAFDLDDSQRGRARWLDHHAAVPRTATTGRRSAGIVGMTGDYRVAAWVTDGGRVVLALRDPDGGTTTEADDAPDSVDPSPLRSDGNTVLAATVPAAEAATVARGLRIDVSFGDGDECEVGQIVTLTIPATSAAKAQDVFRARVIHRDDDPGC